MKNHNFLYLFLGVFIYLLVPKLAFAGGCVDNPGGPDLDCDQNGCWYGVCCQIAGNCPTSCFPAGTEITMASGVKKNIEDIKPGDSVVSQSESGVRSISTVSEMEEPIRDHMCRIDFEDGKNLKLTKEHPLMTQAGWKSISPSSTLEENPGLFVDDLMIGDRVYTELGTKSVVKNWSCWSEKVQTYNLLLDKGAHTYFADGYLAHNKGGGVCTADGVRVDCPAGTQRSNVVIGSQCKRICAGIGTAQVAGACCDWVTTPASGCNWNPCPTINNPDKQCKTCDTPEETWCRTGTTYTYQCDPICTPPTSPTLTSPADGTQFANTSVTLIWNPSSFDADCTNSYGVYIGDSPSHLSLYTTVGTSTNSIVYDGVRGNTYYWEIQAISGGLTANSEIRSFTVLDNVIAGTIYYDPDNTCSTATPWTNGAISVTARGTAYSATVGSNGQYAVTAAIGETYPYLDLSNVPDNYVCSTAVGCNSCPTLTNVGPVPTIGNNFFITDKNEPWWQVIGGGIYSGGLGGGVTVRSEIPVAGSYLIEPGAGGAIGALLRASGSVDVGAGAVSTPGYSTQAKYKGKTMGYDFFAAQMGVLSGQSQDWGADTIDKPAYNATTPRDFYYVRPTSGTATVASPWVVPADEKLVIFVNGNLRINQNITVAEGGFLAFMVNGNVTVDPSVTDIQGLYVIDGQFTTESQYVQSVSSDIQLNVEGSVVAWGGVSLARDMSLGNSLTPAEKFSYRPDFLINMPTKMKTFALRWQEVAPGTFGN